MYKAEIENNGGMLFKVKSKGYEFVIDAEGKAITPPDALLAALGACVGVYIRKYAEGARLDIKNFKVSVEAAFEPDKPMRFKTIRVSIDLGDVALDDRRKKALIDFAANCPVHNTLKCSPQVVIAVI